MLLPDWTLDIDETGAFDGHEPWSCVVGWLRPGLPGADDAVLAADLRALLGAEWPPHATDWNRRGEGDALREAIRRVVEAQPRSWIVAARTWDGRQRPIGGIASSEYAWALRCAFARAALIFRGGPPVRLHTRVADRRVTVHVGRDCARSQMHAVYVHALARDALRGTGVTNVSIQPLNDRFAYDARVPAGIVIADALANHVGHLLHTRRAIPLGALADALATTFGVVSLREIGGRPAWALAADGPHEDALELVARGRPAPAVPPDGTFADEQHAAWQAVFA